MTGDQADLARRIRATLPVGWFSDESPLLHGLLAGLSEAWSWAYAAIQYVEQQTRLRTATGVWLDLIASDYFRTDVRRRPREIDDHFRKRLQSNLLRERATRSAIVAVLSDLTGRQPLVFEPAYCLDTGGYGVNPATSGGLAYNATGGWGSLALPFQCFVTVYRPFGTGIAMVSGWGCRSGGYGTGAIEYADMELMEDQISDAQIYDAISRTLPTAAICWARITD